MSTKYHHINKAYKHFLQKLMEVVNNIAPLKTVRIINTSNEWSDREIAEKLRIRDKLFKKFKSRRLNNIGKTIKRQKMMSEEQSHRRKNSILRRNCQKI